MKTRTTSSLPPYLQTGQIMLNTYQGLQWLNQTCHLPNGFPWILNFWSHCHKCQCITARMNNSSNGITLKKKIKKKCNLHLAQLWTLSWTANAVFLVRGKQKKQKRGVCWTVWRECVVSADVSFIFYFLKRNATDFPLEELEERQHESLLHLFAKCIPGWSANLDYDDLLPTAAK